jgi:5-methylcytosine-specific restriction endonuclease McrA
VIHVEHPKHAAWARPFYYSYAWIQCRRGYAKSVGGLCERCLKRGLYTPGTEVHHKVRLTPENVTDPGVALNWDNLELLCKTCHLEEHETNHHRWRVDEDGGLDILGT